MCCAANAQPGCRYVMALPPRTDRRAGVTDLRLVRPGGDNYSAVRASVVIVLLRYKRGLLAVFCQSKPR